MLARRLEPKVKHMLSVWSIMLLLIWEIVYLKMFNFENCFSYQTVYTVHLGDLTSMCIYMLGESM